MCNPSCRPVPDPTPLEPTVIRTVSGTWVWRQRPHRRAWREDMPTSTEQLIQILAEIIRHHHQRQVIRDNTGSAMWQDRSLLCNTKGQEASDGFPLQPPMAAIVKRKSVLHWSRSRPLVAARKICRADFLNLSIWLAREILSRRVFFADAPPPPLQQREQTSEETVSFSGGTERGNNVLLLRIIAVTVFLMLVGSFVGICSYASTLDWSHVHHNPHLMAHRLRLASLTDEPRMGHAKFIREIMSFYNHRRVNLNMTSNISHWCMAHRMHLSAVRLLRDIEQFLCQASCWLKEHCLEDTFCNFFIERLVTREEQEAEYSANMTVYNKCLCRNMDLSLP